MNVALAARSVVEALGGGMADIQMINMMFGLVAGVFMIAGAMLGLLIGWRRNFRIGVALAFAGELVMAFCSDLTVFIWVGRTLIGLGAALLIPSVLGLVPALYQGARRVFAFGCVTAGTGAAAVMPIPFGVLLDAVGYRIAFVVMAAVFLALLLLSGIIPKTACGGKGLSFDFPGFVSCSIGLFFVMIGIAAVSTFGLVWTPPNAPLSFAGISPTLPMVAIGSLFLVAFSRIEQARFAKGESLLMPRSFLGTAAARNSLLAVAFGFFLAGAFNILVIPYMQIAGGATSLTAGILYAFAGVPMVGLAIFVPKLLPSASPRTIIRVGYIAGGLGCIVCAIGFSSDHVFWTVAAGMLLAGTGIGLCNSHASNAVACSVGEKDAQQSGGIQGTVRDIAFALAAAVLGAVLSVALTGAFSSLADASIPDGPQAAAAERIDSQVVSFMSNQSFIELATSQGIAKEDVEELAKVYGQARLQANQIVLVGLGIASILLVCFTRKIPTKAVAGAKSADAV